MASKNRRKTSNSQPQLKINDAIKVQNQSHHYSNNGCLYYEGDRLFSLLQSFQRKIESELQSNKILPEKLWFKQHFAVGINEVTRLLERMAPSKNSTFVAGIEGSSLLIVNHGRGSPPCSSGTKLQAVLIALDCNPRWLTKHLPSLATSRNVPIIYIKDNKEGSLRLGEVVKVKTAVALGIKVKGSSINQLLEDALHQHKLNVTGCRDSTELTNVSCQ